MEKEKQNALEMGEEEAQTDEKENEEKGRGAVGMENAIRAPERKSTITPPNIPRRTADEGHNIRSRSEFCFPIIRTFGPRSEPPMSDIKTDKGKRPQK